MGGWVLTARWLADEESVERRLDGYMVKKALSDDAKAGERQPLVVVGPSVARRRLSEMDYGRGCREGDYSGCPADAAELDAAVQRPQRVWYDYFHTRPQCFW